MNVINNVNYGRVLKLLAFISALVMMFMSAQFSVDGFSIQQPDRAYIGWLLALIIIIVEMIFNYNLSLDIDWEAQENKRITILMFAGAAAYLYGIATNIVGIIHSGTTPNEFYDYIVPVALGVFLEVVPEPLMVWALLTNGKKKEEKKQDRQEQRDDRKSHIVYPPRHQQEQRKTFNLRDLNPDDLRKAVRSK